MHHLPLPDGHRWTGRTLNEIVLIDPDTCPAGHPVQLTRRGFSRCNDPAHGHRHNSWTCACGQTIYRVPGAYVAGGDLVCLVD